MSMHQSWHNELTINLQSADFTHYVHQNRAKVVLRLFCDVLFSVNLADWKQIRLKRFSNPTTCLTCGHIFSYLHHVRILVECIDDVVKDVEDFRCVSAECNFSLEQEISLSSWKRERSEELTLRFDSGTSLKVGNFFKFWGKRSRNV